MIKVVNITDESWNDQVKKLDVYDVFYLSEYVKTFMNENADNGLPLLFVYENDDDYAINVAFKRDISKSPFFQNKICSGRFFDLISPYGYGGFIGHVSNYQALNDEYEKICREIGFICEFVRFELFSEYRQYYPGEVETRTHNVVRSLNMSLNEMWMDFKHNVRKNIKRANNNELKIIVENTDAHLKDFLDIYYSTMDRNSAEDDYYFSREFFLQLNKMKDNIMYFYVLNGDKVISTELVIYGAENCYSYLGGTNQDYFALRPNEFLKYEIIKWAQGKGLKNFVLGGGYGADDGIFQYKSHLAPHGIVNFYIGSKVFDQAIYDMLVDIRSKDSPECVDSKYFPKYRA